MREVPVLSRINKNCQEDIPERNSEITCTYLADGELMGALRDASDQRRSSRVNAIREINQRRATLGGASLI